MHRRLVQAIVLCASITAFALPAFALDTFDFLSASEKSMGGATSPSPTISRSYYPILPLWPICRGNSRRRISAYRR